MKRSALVMLFLTVSLAIGFASVHAGWNTDPANDPVYQQFLQDTADIRKEIAMDRAELNALLAGENPDTYKARELSARISDNQQKLAELASANGFGRGGSCGGSRGGRGGCGGGCAGAANSNPGSGAGGNGTCGSPGCPNAAAAQ
jgi:hypothetical protein